MGIKDSRKYFLPVTLGALIVKSAWTPHIATQGAVYNIFMNLTVSTLY